jgi:hypothetical protein
MVMQEKIDFVLVGGPYVEADREQRAEILADMATEVGLHAAKEALATMARVCNTLPIEARMAALAVAMSHIGWKLPAVALETDAIKPGLRRCCEGYDGRPTDGARQRLPPLRRGDKAALRPLKRAGGLGK